MTRLMDDCWNTDYEVSLGSRFYVWWLRPVEVDAYWNYLSTVEHKDLSSYILRELGSMRGRSLRSRLWVSEEFEYWDIGVSWDASSELCKSLEATKSGGLVIRDSDLATLKTIALEGGLINQTQSLLITDLNMNIIH